MNSAEEPVASAFPPSVFTTFAQLLQMSLSPSVPHLLVIVYLRSLFGCYPRTRSLSVGPKMDVPAIKRLIRLGQDREKKAKRRKVSPLELSQWCLTTALCIAAAMHGDVTAAADWLACPHRRGKPLNDTIDHETTKVELKNVYDAKAACEVALWLDPVASPLPRSCLKTALKWSYEYKAKQHVRSANVDFGAPVRSCRLIEYYNAKLREDSMETHLAEVGTIETVIGRKWCRKWRTCHGAAVGALRSREPVELLEKRNQA